MYGIIRGKEFIELDWHYWNRVKGMAILCVVLGHLCPGVKQFVYLFHLQLFFFVSGYFYTEEKYGTTPGAYIKKRVKRIWKPYIMLYAVAILFHNLLMKIGLQLSSCVTYSPVDVIKKFILAVFGNGEEILLGPLWFLPVLGYASVTLAIFVSLSIVVEKKTGSVVAKLAFQVVFVLVMVWWGYPLVRDRAHVITNYHIAAVVLPFLYMGYLVRRYLGEIEGFLRWIPGIFAFVITFLLSRRYWVDVTLGMVFPQMYLYSGIAIYMCLCAAKYLRRLPFVSRIFEYMGTYSMEIMVIHFIVLRIFDKCLTFFVFHDVSGELYYDRMPIAFDHLWFIYLLVVLPITLGLLWTWNRIKKACGVLSRKE